MNTQKKEITFPLLAATGLSVAALALVAPALAAPSDIGSVQDTVNSLEANGYKVILNKVGSAPLNQCTVAAVRPGQVITHRVSESGHHEGSSDEVLHTTVHVDVKC